MIIKSIYSKIQFRRATSWLLSLFLITSTLLAGCGGQNTVSSTKVDNPSVVSNPNENVNTEKKPRLSNAQKVGITLVGAAALYYIYNQHKNSQEKTGVQGQYYLSKNGRVYYRDAEHQVHWVTPPREGIQVPVQEAQRYQDFQGYNNRPTGRDLTSLPEVQGASSY